MNNTEMVKEAISQIEENARQADVSTEDISNLEVQVMIEDKHSIQISTGEISDIRYTLEHEFI